MKRSLYLLLLALPAAAETYLYADHVLQTPTGVTYLDLTDVSRVYANGANYTITTATDPEDVATVGGTLAGVQAAKKCSVRTVAGADSVGGTGAVRVIVHGLSQTYAEVQVTFALAGSAGLGGTKVAGDSMVTVLSAWVDSAGSGAVNADSIKIKLGNSVMALILPAKNKSSAAYYMVPDGYVGYLTSWGASSAAPDSASVTVELLTRKTGKLWLVEDVGATSTGALERRYPVPMPLPARTEVKVRALEVTGSGTSVQASLGLLLVASSATPVSVPYVGDIWTNRR